MGCGSTQPISPAKNTPAHLAGWGVRVLSPCGMTSSKVIPQSTRVRKHEPPNELEPLFFTPTSVDLIGFYNPFINLRKQGVLAWILVLGSDGTWYLVEMVLLERTLYSRTSAYIHTDIRISSVYIYIYRSKGVLRSILALSSSLLTSNLSKSDQLLTTHRSPLTDNQDLTYRHPKTVLE